MFKFFLFAFILFICNQPIAAQTKLENTLLWRITGNGLKTPSYLYGTAHVKYESLFQFGDSVLAALERSAYMGVEMTPKDASRLWAKVIEANLEREEADEDETTTSKKEDNKQTSATKDSIKKPQPLQKELNKMAEWTAIKKDKKMERIIDFYLYELAKRKGKILGSLESVNDRFYQKVLNNNFDDYDEGDIWQNVFSVGEILHCYAKQDLSLIDSVVQQKYSGSQRSEFLLQRNVNMVRVMDSVAKRMPSFFAVGAAHLPGDSGIIDLLRKLNYTVSPVFSSKYIPPVSEEDNLKTKWIRNTTRDGRLDFKLPDTCNRFNSAYGDMNIYLYTDIGKRLFYVIYEQFAAQEKYSEVEFKKFGKVYLESQGFDIETFLLKYKYGYPIIVATGELNDLQTMAELMIIDNHIYVFTVQAFTMSDLKESKDIRFFFENIYPLNRKKDEKWKTIVHPNQKHQLRMPENGWHYKKFQSKKLISEYMASNDAKTNAIYMFHFMENQPGYTSNLDIEALNTFYQSTVEDAPKNTDIDSSYFMYNGYPAIRIDVSRKNKLLERAQLIMVGNKRYYCRAYIDNDSTGISKFFNSLIINTETTQWQKQSLPLFRATTISPNEFKIHYFDDGDFCYIATDSISGVQYNVTAYTLSKYAYYPSDLKLYEYYAKEWKNDTDTFFSSAISIHLQRSKYKILYKTNTLQLYRKIGVHVNGDTIIKLEILAPEKNLTKNTERFFDEFSFNEKEPYYHLTKKTHLIIEDLQSNDTIIYENARVGLNKLMPDSADVPILLDALLKKYPSDSQYTYSVYDLLTNRLKTINDTAKLEFVKRHYSPDKSNTIKNALLKVAIDNKDSASYQFFFEQLKEMNSAQLNEANFGYSITDSSALVKPYIPQLLSMLSDTSKYSFLLPVINSLLNDSLINSTQLKDKQKYFVQYARYLLKRYSFDSSNIYNFPVYSLMNLLASNTNSDAVALFEQYRKLENPYLISYIIQKQLSFGFVPAQNLIDDASANPIVCLEVHHSLRQHEKMNLFPKHYKNQSHFAKAYVYETFLNQEDLDVESAEFIERRLFSVKDSSFYAYIFKVNIGTKEKPEYFTAIVGGFSKNENEITIPFAENYSWYIYISNEYNKENLDNEFKLFLEEFEIGYEEMINEEANPQSQIPSK